jgi:hypothetical protein
MSSWRNMKKNGVTSAWMQTWVATCTKENIQK